MTQPVVDFIDLKISIAEDDLLFKEVQHYGPNCICSRCACLIEEELISIILENAESTQRQYRYHASCAGLDNWFI